VTYPDGTALIPDQFDEHTIVFVRHPADSPQFSEDELDRLLVEHLA